MSKILLKENWRSRDTEYEDATEAACRASLGESEGSEGLSPRIGTSKEDLMRYASSLSDLVEIRLSPTCLRTLVEDDSVHSLFQTSSEWGTLWGVPVSLQPTWGPEYAELIQEDGTLSRWPAREASPRPQSTTRSLIDKLFSE